MILRRISSRKHCANGQVDQRNGQAHSSLESRNGTISRAACTNGQVDQRNEQAHSSLGSRNGAISRAACTNGQVDQRNGQAHSSLGSRNGTISRAAFYDRTDQPPVTPFPTWKRILDLSFILIALPVWLPLMLLVMALIRFNSSGPIFYRQERVGYHRKRFMIFKFRTMHVNAETRTHEDYCASLMRSESPMTKLDAAGDSRLIPGARFLRASGLDELPQIFNVLLGDMSLVGPRPCLPCEFNLYEEWQQRRVNAPPGVTGYWQVNGKNRTTFNQMMFLDLFYVDKMSIWLDFRIILKTIPVLVSETIAALNRFRARTVSRSIAKIPQPVPVISSRNGAHYK
jgi:lipopolysaccharide/colanic/teichoic acid biosynthesis glycosyltransferase